MKASIDILTKREQRQQDILKRLNVCSSVITIKVNYPGNQKLNAFTFYVAATILDVIQKQVNLTFDVEYSVEGVVGIAQSLQDSVKLKHELITIESTHPLGRFVDIDVIGVDGAIKRMHLGYSARSCFLCDEAAHVCVRSQKHAFGMVIQHIHECVIDYAKTSYQEMVRFAAMAELSVHPSFGLVSPLSSGIHQDMDVNTFLTSIDAIAPWFNRIASIDNTQSEDAVFKQLRQLGVEIEAVMFKATNNINTHKGFIFLMLLVLGVFHYKGNHELENSIKQLAKPLILDYDDPLDNTPGIMWQQSHGILGIRGLAMTGLNVVFSELLPFYLKNRSIDDHNDALVMTLLKTMSHLDDTTVLKRSGLKGLTWLKQESQAVIQDRSLWQSFSNQCQMRRISPGGSADVLAVVVLCASFFYDSNKEE